MNANQQLAMANTSKWLTGNDEKFKQIKDSITSLNDPNRQSGKMMTLALKENATGIFGGMDADWIDKHPISAIANGAIYNAEYAAAKAYLTMLPQGEEAAQNAANEVEKYFIEGLSNPETVEKTLTELAFPAEDGTLAVKYQNNNIETPMLEGVDVGSATGSFIVKAIKPTFIGKGLIWATGKELEAGALEEANYVQDIFDTERILGGGASTTANVVGMGLSLFEMLGVGKVSTAISAAKGTLGTAGYFLANSAFSDLLGNEGSAERYIIGNADQKAQFGKFMASRIFDVGTYALSMGITGPLTQKFNETGTMKSIMTAMQAGKLNQKNLMRLATLPLTNMVYDVAADVMIDYGVHNSIALLGGEDMFTTGQKAQFSLTNILNNPNMSSQDKFEEIVSIVGKDVMRRAGMRFANGAINQAVSRKFYGKEDQGLESKTYWNEMIMKEIGDEHPMMSKFIRSVGTLSYKLMPNNLNDIINIRSEGNATLDNNGLVYKTDLFNALRTTTNPDETMQWYTYQFMLNEASKNILYRLFVDHAGDIKTDKMARFYDSTVHNNLDRFYKTQLKANLFNADNVEGVLSAYKAMNKFAVEDAARQIYEKHKEDNIDDTEMIAGIRNNTSDEVATHFETVWNTLKSTISPVASASPTPKRLIYTEFSDALNRGLAKAMSMSEDYIKLPGEVPNRDQIYSSITQLLRNYFGTHSDVVMKKYNDKGGSYKNETITRDNQVRFYELVDSESKQANSGLKSVRSTLAGDDDFKKILDGFEDELRNINDNKLINDQSTTLFDLFNPSNTGTVTELVRDISIQMKELHGNKPVSAASIVDLNNRVLEASGKLNQFYVEQLSKLINADNIPLEKRVLLASKTEAKRRGLLSTLGVRLNVNQLMAVEEKYSKLDFGKFNTYLKEIGRNDGRDYFGFKVSPLIEYERTTRSVLNPILINTKNTRLIFSSSDMQKLLGGTTDIENAINFVVNAYTPGALKPVNDIQINVDGEIQTFDKPFLDKVMLNAGMLESGDESARLRQAKKLVGAEILKVYSVESTHQIDKYNNQNNTNYEYTGNLDPNLVDWIQKGLDKRLINLGLQTKEGNGVVATLNTEDTGFGKRILGVDIQIKEENKSDKKLYERINKATLTINQMSTDMKMRRTWDKNSGTYMTFDNLAAISMNSNRNPMPSEYLFIDDFDATKTEVIQYEDVLKRFTAKSANLIRDVRTIAAFTAGDQTATAIGEMLKLIDIRTYDQLSKNPAQLQGFVNSLAMSSIQMRGADTTLKLDDKFDLIHDAVISVLGEKAKVIDVHKISDHGILVQLEYDDKLFKYDQEFVDKLSKLNITMIGLAGAGDKPILYYSSLPNTAGAEDKIRDMHESVFKMVQDEYYRYNYAKGSRAIGNSNGAAVVYKSYIDDLYRALKNDNILNSLSFKAGSSDSSTEADAYYKILEKAIEYKRKSFKGLSGMEIEKITIPDNEVTGMNDVLMFIENHIKSLPAKLASSTIDISDAMKAVNDLSNQIISKTVDPNTFRQISEAFSNLAAKLNDAEAKDIDLFEKYMMSYELRKMSAIDSQQEGYYQLDRTKVLSTIPGALANLYSNYKGMKTLEEYARYLDENKGDATFMKSELLKFVALKGLTLDVSYTDIQKRMNSGMLESTFGQKQTEQLVDNWITDTRKITGDTSGDYVYLALKGTGMKISGTGIVREDGCMPVREDLINAVGMVTGSSNTNYKLSSRFLGGLAKTTVEQAKTYWNGMIADPNTLIEVVVNGAKKRIKAVDLLSVSNTMSINSLKSYPPELWAMIQEAVNRFDVTQIPGSHDTVVIKISKQDALDFVNSFSIHQPIKHGPAASGYNPELNVNPMNSAMANTMAKTVSNQLNQMMEDSESHENYLNKMFKKVGMANWGSTMTGQIRYRDTGIMEQEIARGLTASTFTNAPDDTGNVHVSVPIHEIYMMAASVWNKDMTSIERKNSSFQLEDFSRRTFTGHNGTFVELLNRQEVLSQGELKSLATELLNFLHDRKAVMRTSLKGGENAYWVWGVRSPIEGSGHTALHLIYSIRNTDQRGYYTNAISQFLEKADVDGDTLTWYKIHEDAFMESYKRIYGKAGNVIEAVAKYNANAFLETKLNKMSNPISTPRKTPGRIEQAAQINSLMVQNSFIGQAIFNSVMNKEFNFVGEIMDMDDLNRIFAPERSAEGKVGITYQGETKLHIGFNPTNLIIFKTDDKGLLPTEYLGSLKTENIISNGDYNLIYSRSITSKQDQLTLTKRDSDTFGVNVIGHIVVLHENDSIPIDEPVLKNILGLWSRTKNDKNNNEYFSNLNIETLKGALGQYGDRIGFMVADQNTKAGAYHTIFNQINGILVDEPKYKTLSYLYSKLHGKNQSEFADELRRTMVKLGLASNLQIDKLIGKTGGTGIQNAGYLSAQVSRLIESSWNTGMKEAFNDNITSASLRGTNSNNAIIEKMFSKVKDNYNTISALYDLISKKKIDKTAVDVIGDLSNGTLLENLDLLPLQLSGYINLMRDRQQKASSVNMPKELVYLSSSDPDENGRTSIDRYYDNYFNKNLGIIYDEDELALLKGLERFGKANELITSYMVGNAGENADRLKNEIGNVAYFDSGISKESLVTAIMKSINQVGDYNASLIDEISVREYLQDMGIGISDEATRRMVYDNDLSKVPQDAYAFADQRQKLKRKDFSDRYSTSINYAVLDTRSKKEMTISQLVQRGFEYSSKIKSQDAREIFKKVFTSLLNNLNDTSHKYAYLRSMGLSDGVLDIIKTAHTRDGLRMTATMDEAKIMANERVGISNIVVDELTNLKRQFGDYDWKNVGDIGCN